MAQRGVPAGWDSPADRPSVHRITVESDSRPSATVRRPHVLLAVAVLAAIAAAIAIAVLPGRGGGGRSASPTPAPQTPAPQPSVLVESGPPSALAPGLYRFPVGCPYSRVTTVERNRRGLCTPHNGYVAVVLRRVGGVWHASLEPINTPSCSPVPIPPLARGRVKACRH